MLYTPPSRRGFGNRTGFGPPLEGALGMVAFAGGDFQGFLFEAEYEAVFFVYTASPPAG